MLPDESGTQPRIASDKNSLGVVADGEHRDVTVIEGKVKPSPSEGMSVAPTPSSLPSHRIPLRYKNVYPDARSNKPLLCWYHQESRFEEGAFAPKLWLRIDTAEPNHGLIGPHEESLIEDFRAALASTQSNWVMEPWDGMQL